MLIPRLLLAACVACCLTQPVRAASASASAAVPLAIGDTWTLESSVLAERRRINVYRPAGLPPDTPLPVLYMPDGGMLEDFLHVAGLLQVGAGNGTTRPFLLVGIENTERRRDLTGPTDNPKDRSIAPRVGGSRAFRTFLRDELMPEIARRYRISGRKTLIIATSADGKPIDGAPLAASFGHVPGLAFRYDDWPGETHATVYHPAALKAFRFAFRPPAAP